MESGNGAGEVPNDPQFNQAEEENKKDKPMDSPFGE